MNPTPPVDVAAIVREFDRQIGALETRIAALLTIPKLFREANGLDETLAELRREVKELRAQRQSILDPVDADGV